MTAYEYDIEGVETQKYLAAVLRGRALIGEWRGDECLVCNNEIC